MGTNRRTRLAKKIKTPDGCVTDVYADPIDETLSQLKFFKNLSDTSDIETDNEGIIVEVNGDWPDQPARNAKKVEEMRKRAIAKINAKTDAEIEAMVVGQPPEKPTRERAKEIIVSLISVVNGISLSLTEDPFDFKSVAIDAIIDKAVEKIFVGEVRNLTTAQKRKLIIDSTNNLLDNYPLGNKMSKDIFGYPQQEQSIKDGVTLRQDIGRKPEIPWCNGDYISPQREKSPKPANWIPDKFGHKVIETPVGAVTIDANKPMTDSEAKDMLRDIESRITTAGKKVITPKAETKKTTKKSKNKLSNMFTLAKTLDDIHWYDLITDTHKTKVAAKKTKTRKWNEERFVDFETARDSRGRFVSLKRSSKRKK